MDQNNSQIEKPLTNTITVQLSDRANIVYQSPPNGANIMGLVAIKNTTKRYQNNDPKPAFQFTFKHLKVENCYVNHRVATVLSNKSSLYATLKSMVPGLYDTHIPDASEAFEVLQECLGQWFNVMTITRSYTDAANQPKKYTKVVDNIIEPITDEAIKNLGDCREYFSSLPNKSPTEQARPIQAPPIANTIQGTEKPTGFEAYPDAPDEKKAYPFAYNLSAIDPTRLGAAQKLVKDAKGIIKKEGNSIIGRTKSEMLQLTKYLIADTLESDRMPFPFL